MPRLTVLIPVLNERPTLARVVEDVLATGRADEIIVIDDGSNDGSSAVIAELVARHPGLVRSARHEVTRGKGAGIRTGLAMATGDLILVQDADREYDPADIPALLAPFVERDAVAVYGSRNLRPNPRSPFAFYWGGRLLSAWTNLLYGARLTDEATGYKIVRTELLRSLNLRDDGFSFCAELTGQLLRAGVAICEVPISYRPRTFAEGKKIRWRDGWVALWVLARIRMVPRARPMVAATLIPRTT